MTAVDLEASGGYERAIADALVAAGLAVRVLDPAQVRHFGRALGQRAKTDPIDAQLIARCVGQLDGQAPARDPDLARWREAVAHRTALIAKAHRAQAAARMAEDPELVQRSARSWGTSRRRSPRSRVPCARPCSATPRGVPGPGS